MPRNPRKIAISVRIAPHLLDAVRDTGVGVTEAIEDGLALWLRSRAKKAAPKGKGAVKKATKDAQAANRRGC